MQITLNYLAQVRRAAGVETERIAAGDAADIRSVLVEAAGRHGPEFRALILDESGHIRPSVMVLVNGVPADREKPHVLSGGDTVSILTAMAGG